MATFPVTITDQGLLDALTADRIAHNTALGSSDAEREAHDDYAATDADYVQFVMYRAVQSYQIVYGT